MNYNEGMKVEIGTVGLDIYQEDIIIGNSYEYGLIYSY